MKFYMELTFLKVGLERPFYLGSWSIIEVKYCVRVYDFWGNAELIGFTGEWTDIVSYLPDGWVSDPVKWRSATAATFAASLELVKEGNLEIRQSESFAPIELRKRTSRQ